MHANLNDSGFNLLNKLIYIDYDKRFNTQEILNHPYLESYKRDENEPSDIKPFDFSFEIEVNKF
jgi:serine/threonine protein kinase